MKKYLGFIIISIILFSCGQAVSAQHTLIVEIEDLRNNSGQISLELLDENKNQVDGQTASIKNNKCVITFKNLKTKKYAVRYFHDEDANRKMESNLIGIPIEGYGLSNNAFGKFGPKKFEKWLFLVKGKTTIRVSPKY